MSERIWEAERRVVTSENGCGDTVIKFSSSIYEANPGVCQVHLGAGCADVFMYLRAPDLMKLARLFEQCSKAAEGRV